MQRSFRSILGVIRSNITWRRAVTALGIAAASWGAYLLIFKGYVLPKTGFGEYTDSSGKIYPAKTVWDLLELLIVPAALGFGALWFNHTAHTRERERAEDQQREATLQHYLDQMAELLLREKLLEKKDNSEDPVLDVAQVRTITALRKLDQDRRSVLFKFLRDADLATFVLVKASLTEANLSKTDMAEIDLSGAELTGANLHGANLHGAKYDSQTKWPEGFDYVNSGAIGPKANLHGADLRGAKLRRSDLRSANLTKANLTKALLNAADLTETDLSEADLGGARLRGTKLISANLSGVDLSGADLLGAIMSEANLNEADLAGAELRMADLSGTDLSGVDLRGASLSEAKYNSQTKWPEGFDYENSGAILDDE